MAFSLATYYDASFAGVSFFELTDDAGNYSDFDTTYPHTIVQYLNAGNAMWGIGPTVRSVTMRAGVDTAQYTALRAKVSINGTLSYHAGSMSCNLVGITSAQRAGNSDAWHLTLEFKTYA